MESTVRQSEGGCGEVLPPATRVAGEGDYLSRETATYNSCLVSLESKVIDILV